MGLKDKLADKPVIGTVLAVQDRYNEDAAGQFAAAIAYYGFLSVFPLILLTLSITGFVLAGEASASARAQVQELITSVLPGLSSQLGDTIDAIVDARAGTGVVGLLLLSFSGMRIVDSAQVATSRIFRVDLTEVSALKKRGRQVAALAVLGLLALAGSAAGSLVGLRTSSPLTVLISIGWTALSLAIDFTLFFVAYRLLTAAEGPPSRDLWPGALLGAVGWTALKVIGSTIVARQVASASEVYGSLGSIIGMLFLLFLAARLYLYGAEWNALRAESRHGALPFPQDESADVEQIEPRTVQAESSREQSSANATALVDPTDAGQTYARPWASVRPALAFLVAVGALAAVVAVRGMPSAD